MYRAGIIGCSYIGVKDPDCHWSAYLENEYISQVATCDIDESKKPSAFANFYTDYMTMVKEEHLDIVSVCTPVNTHCQIVTDIAPYVKAIYCEKPMAGSLKECDIMNKHCEEHGVLLQVNHQRRFIAPKLRFSRDILDTGSHAFDLIRMIFGEIKSVSLHNVITESGYIELEYVPTMEEHIFELDCTHKKTDRMIKRGVTHLVNCLQNNNNCLQKDYDSCSNGYDGKEALRWALKYKELYESQK